MNRPTRVPVSLGDRAYDVLIGNGLLSHGGRLLSPFARNGRIIVVSDGNVWQAQGERLKAGLAGAGVEAVPILVPEGEAAKSWSGLENLVERLLALGVGRADHLIAFGGGVVGDLAGFAAGIVKRGIGFVQIPTSLLAQLDSSVGGKTAINSPAGKNLVGLFHQPAMVLIDPEVLGTLDRRQARAGYAELVKYGLIGDPDFFRWCEAQGAAVLEGSPEARHHAIATSVAAKARIVAADERETQGARALLNLGHTFGHALEADAGFSDQLLHGEAVAIGMVLAFRFSAERGLCHPDEAERVESHLRSVGLPTDFHAEPGRLIEYIRQDKKAEQGRVPFILVRGIGQAFLDSKVDLGEVERFLRSQG